MKRCDKMLEAEDPKTKERIMVLPGMTGKRAICPGCKGEVIAIIGELGRLKHWRHYNGLCKYDSEPETIWHQEWKNNAKKLGMEIEKIFDPNQRYRADIYDPKRNMVTEVQHSPIDMETIIVRSSFYESKGIKIRWIFDFIERHESGKLYLHVGILGMEFKQKYQNKHIHCLFDEYGLPKYDTNFNIGIDYDKHTNSTLKIGRMDKVNGNGYGKLFSSMIVEKEFNVDYLIFGIECRKSFNLVKIDDNKYTRKNSEIICDIREEITIIKRDSINDFESSIIKYKGYEESDLFIHLNEYNEDD